MATVKKRIKKTSEKMGEQQDGVPGTEGHPSRLGARLHTPELKPACLVWCGRTYIGNSSSSSSQHPSY